ncbi:hypothetical protein [Priestia aryabhattai]|uniref:hypothetical protein n=1 Tax=Priestia aryabhattai TaxID=412384 RepID=UPI002E1AFEA5|nr:hypothetical protein [Priestia aryabhattai]
MKKLTFILSAAMILISIYLSDHAIFNNKKEAAVVDPATTTYQANSISWWWQ